MVPDQKKPELKLYLIDVSSFIFRAFFAIRSLTNRSGEPTNAVYGVATMLSRLAEEAKPEYLAVAFDSKGPSFREEIYPEYKANRSEPPEDLIPQFARIEELIRCFEMPSFRQTGVEADDLIATAARRWCELGPDHTVVIVSSDKDLMQLVDERVLIWDTMSGKRYGPEQVEEKFGVKPTQIRDYLGLVGDSSDNIPGVPSIGPKSAVDLLRAHGTLSGILKAAKNGEISGKKGEVLKLHEKDALLSAELATVKEDLAIEVSAQQLKYEFHLSEAGLALFKELDFHSLVQKWSAQGLSSSDATPVAVVAPPVQAESPGRVASQSTTFRLVNTQAALKSVLRGIEKSIEFGFDLETTSLNPRLAEIVGIAICHDREFACYIPVGHRGTDVPQLGLAEVLSALKPYLENPRYKKIGQNLKYDFSVLLNQGIEPDGIGADTMVASYVLEPEGRHNLQTLAAKYLNYNVVTYEQVCGSGKDQLGFDQVPIDQAVKYSAEDAWIALQLWETLKPKLDAEGLMPIFVQVDLPLVPVLVRMECQGVCIDVDWLSQLSREFASDLMKIEQKIAEFTNGPINLNSPKQLAHLLFDQLKLPTQGKTKTGFSTDAQVLEALAPLHEVPSLLLEYREISKLKGTYVDPLPKLRDPKTGKIHASFHQTVAATGRLSSSDPNLQNIPIRSERGIKIRKAFVPSPGNVLFAADYSQIELRLLAHMSGDPELIRSFQKNEDVHQRTASEIFGVRPEEVNESQRAAAKAINFGLMYGKSAFSLAQELKIGRKEAQTIIDRYFERYGSVKMFLSRLITDAKEQGFATTLLGRKRGLPELHSKNAAVRANAERMAMNTPIQGTAADLMKLAMIAVDEYLLSTHKRSKLIIQVHDEVVLDCVPVELEEIKLKVVKLMETALDGFVRLEVPLCVNTGTGANWMEI